MPAIAMSVTRDDTYVLMAFGSDQSAAAVSFIETGGPTDEAIRIIPRWPNQPHKPHGHNGLA
jgi:hypothetical protein